MAIHEDRTLRRRALATALAGLVAPFALVGVPAPAAETSPTAGHPMIGTEAPPFELKAAGGETLSLRDLRGQYVVLHFGASW